MSWNNQSYWNTLNVSVRIFYVIGSDVLYDDKNNQVSFIRVNITESRENLKYKVIEALKYIYRNYDFKYILKTDDDVINNYELWETKLWLHLDRLHKNKTIPYAGIYCGLHIHVPYRYCSGLAYAIHRLLLPVIFSYPESHYEFAEDRTIGKIVYNTFGKVSRNKLLIQPFIEGLPHLRAPRCKQNDHHCIDTLKNMYFNRLSFHIGKVNEIVKDLYYLILS